MLPRLVAAFEFPFLRAGGVLLLCVGLVANVAAQNVVEIRIADTKYRYADWDYSFSNGAVIDLFYVGVPGSNEFNLGGGYAIKRGAFVVSPLAYLVIGKEGGQRGVKLAVHVSVDRAGWKVLGFLGDYIPASGDVDSYQVLDTLDITRSLGKRWEAGLQSGFFRTGGTWSPQVGPLVKLNDRHGAWAASYRFGPENELRVGRVLTF